MTQRVECVILLGGLVQLGIAVTSLAVPRLLDWKHRLASLDEFTRRLFWVYAAFTLLVNTGLGLVAVLEPAALSSGEGLGRTICLFIALYWLLRLALQYVVLDTRPLRLGRLPRAGYHLLTAAFVFLVVVFGAAALFPRVYP